MTAADPMTALELDRPTGHVGDGIVPVDFVGGFSGDDEQLPTDWLVEPFLPRGRQVALDGGPGGQVAARS